MPQILFLEGRQLLLIGEAIKFTSMTFIGHHTFQKALLSIRKMDDFSSQFLRVVHGLYSEYNADLKFTAEIYLP